MYLDLFDDGLYQHAVRGDGSLESLKDHLRTAAFIHLVFGRGPLRVPEQWAVSSAAAIDVLAEIASGYMAHVAQQSTEAPAPPPIEFVCFPRDPGIVGDVAPEDVLAAALFERATLAKRLRTVPLIDVERGAKVEAREPLLDFFRARSRAFHAAAYGEPFRRGLGDALQDQARASALTTLFRYCRDVQPPTVRPSQDYAARLAEYAQRLNLLIRRSEPSPLGQRIVATLDEAQRRGLRAHDYVPMLQIWREIDATDDEALMHVMRSGMHAALVQWTQAPSFVNAYDAYEPAEVSKAAAFLEGVGLVDRPAEGLEWRAVYGIVTEKAARGGLPLAGNWTEVWCAVFNLKIAKQYRRFRRELYRRAHDDSMRFQDEPNIDRLFAYVMEHAEAFRIERSSPLAVRVSVERPSAGWLEGADDGLNAVEKGSGALAALAATATATAAAAGGGLTFAPLGALVSTLKVGRRIGAALVGPGGSRAVPVYRSIPRKPRD